MVHYRIRLQVGLCFEYQVKRSIIMKITDLGVEC